MKIVLIKSNTNLVKAILVGNNEQQYIPPPGYTAIIYPVDTVVGVNWTFDGSKFISPPDSSFDDQEIPEEN